MKLFLTIAAWLCMLCTVGATFVVWILCLAGCANSTDQQLRTLKLWSVGSGIAALLAILGCLALLRAQLPGWASLVAITPSLFLFIVFCIKMHR